jgi:transposase
MPLEHAVL